MENSLCCGLLPQILGCFAEAAALKWCPDCCPERVSLYLNIMHTRKGGILSLGFCCVPSKPSLFISGNPSEQHLCLSQSVLVLQPRMAVVCIGFLCACCWQLSVAGSVLLQHKQCSLYEWLTWVICLITESALSQSTNFMCFFFFLNGFGK